MSKHIALAKKLKELAERGFGGEKLNAEKMLNDIIKKHNLTIEEIEGEKQQDFFFNLITSEFTLWYQIVKKTNYDIKVYGEIPKKDIRKLMLGGNYMVTCTVSEYVEIEAKHNFFKNLFKSELEVFTSAFIEANDLGVDPPDNYEEKLTNEEYLELKRIIDLSGKIKKGVFNKQIDQPTKP